MKKKEETKDELLEGLEEIKQEPKIEVKEVKEVKTKPSVYELEKEFINKYGMKPTILQLARLIKMNQ